ncbi:hypothetical protein AB4165_06425 [Vibrio cyclitrophicus]|uniref:hypothetical protein n=1 Tax=Vibrio toranzoniae TaxID=1194427 RepID=UPI001376FEDC|nr:hypothetical protein [Vibrio toranzoniae]NAZ69888.1 hypothetical protein [Vibrio toranzoniae]
MKAPKMSFDGIASSLKGMYEAKKDFDKVREFEKTKRNDSNNRTKENIEMIHAQRDVILRKLDNSFELKKAQTCKTFDVIDNAMESGNLDALALGLNAMTSISEDTSLPSLSNTQKLLDKDDAIDI